MRKPVPSVATCVYRGVAVFAVDFGLSPPQPFRFATADVPDRIRDEMVDWLVKQAEFRGIEWTPAYARRVAFGDE